MAEQPSATEFLPTRRSLKALREAADHCRGCDLYRNATQAVFGEGPRTAKIFMVGEMPGDQEDIEGKPFVGPAGRLLDEAVVEAELSRTYIYITNAVKHFRWEPRGKRRLHKKPNSRQINACHPWLQAEALLIKPEIVVCLGATAAQALLGRTFRITQQRGTFLPSEWSPYTLATHHPSAILRTPDSADRHRKREELVADLRLVAKRLESLPEDGKGTRRRTVSRNA